MSMTEDENDDKQAWIARGWSSRSKVYHTNEDCPSLTRCDNCNEITMSEAQRRGFTQCKNCTRDYGDGVDYNDKYQQILLDAANDD